MFTTASIIFNFFITVYIVSGLAILYHFRKYRWPGDLTVISTIFFVIGSLFFLGLSIYFFISFPWQLI
jgi:hypothetical protein